jgi:hypothetical protein
MQGTDLFLSKKILPAMRLAKLSQGSPLLSEESGLQIVGSATAAACSAN